VISFSLFLFSTFLEEFFLDGSLKILNSYKRRETFLKIKLITIIYFQTKLK
jgi:hypothetical protein